MKKFFSPNSFEIFWNLPDFIWDFLHIRNRLYQERNATVRETERRNAVGAWLCK